MIDRLMQYTTPVGERTMKQEIDHIINGCINDYISNGQIIREEYVNLIINLLPKWRVPSVDGFPEKKIECLFLLHNDIILHSRMVNFKSHDDYYAVKKWLPVSELLKIMEVNK